MDILRLTHQVQRPVNALEQPLWTRHGELMLFSQTRLRQESRQVNEYWAFIQSVFFFFPIASLSNKQTIYSSILGCII